MDTVLVRVPYHLGRRDVGLATGVPVLAERLAREFGIAGVEVESSGDSWNEVGASMDVVRAVAGTVREVVAAGDFPLVVAGVCSASLGVVAGLAELDSGSPGELGVVWFDAHGDFNTPETTPTGFFDGMPLAMLTGAGWETLRVGLDGLRPIDGANIALVGARDLDPGEQERLERSAVRWVRPGEPVQPALDALAERVRGVYLHVDLDVLDPSEGRANRLACPGGPTAADVASAIAEVVRRFTIRAAALTAYEPDCDPEGKIPHAAALIARQIVRARVPA
jgi:arginase